MKEIKDCKGKTIPVFGKGFVESCKAVATAVPADSVYSIKINISAKEKSLPQPGQFYMLRATCGKTYLGRPISVFHLNIIPEKTRGCRDIKPFIIFIS